MKKAILNIGLLIFASAHIVWCQPEVIWDRSYLDLPYMTVADVKVSDSNSLLIVGQADLDAVYRVMDSTGFNALNLTLRTNNSGSNFHAVYPISGDRVFVHCNSCWRQFGDNVTRVYSATESSLGGYVVPPGAFGYPVPMQVQPDGSIVGGAAHLTAGARHGWVVDKWRWGAAMPEWSSDVVMATVDGQTSGGFFPSNMRVNRTDRLLPAGIVLIQPNFPQVRQPFWFALTPTGAPLWTQTYRPATLQYYMADDRGAQLLTLAENRWDIRALMGDPNGAVRWDVPIGFGLSCIPVKPDSEEITTAIFHRTESQSEWLRIDSSGSVVNRIALPLYGRSRQTAEQTFVDEYGGLYVYWFAYDGSLDLVNRRLVLIKHDEMGRTIWEWEVEAHPTDFLAGRIVMRGGVGFYVTYDARRIVKFRIRAAFAEGDASGDGCVDDKDLAMTLEAFGTNDPSADFDSNGLVDDRDLERVLRNFGLGCGE